MNSHVQMEQFDTKFSILVALINVNKKFFSLPPESSNPPLSPLSTRDQKITKINLYIKRN